MSDHLYIEDSCPICSDEFSVNRKMYNLACGHVFCRGCIDSVHPRACPICRQRFQEHQIECVGPWETGTMPSSIRGSTDCNVSQSTLRLEWVAARRGFVPLNAIDGGWESDARILYVARAVFMNGIHPGKADGHVAHISYGGRERRLISGYEILVGSRSSIRWVSISGTFSYEQLCGAVPLRAGNEEDGTPLFAVRALIDGGVHLGKVKVGGNAHIPYGGRERFATDYHVIVHA